MSQLKTESSVGEWVAQYPSTSRVFEAHQIDYCCGGGKSLKDACAARELEVQQIVDELEQTIDSVDDASYDDWLAAPLAELCDHIESTHHAYLRVELPRLTQMIDKVVSAHGAARPELADLQHVFAELRAELEPHMFKEEQILFPAIRQLEQSESSPSFPFGSVGNPIRMMEHEHDNAGGGLARIREITRAYEVPEGACNTYRAMLDGLRELEANMHQHIHKENNILFPRALAKESAGMAV